MEDFSKYLSRGVSPTKDDVHQAIKNISKGLYPKAFCKIIPDFLTGDKDYCLVMHADGAGTKSSLAYLYWKETGDMSVWKGIAQDAIVMNTDDLACVGVTDNFILSSTIGRNKNLIDGKIIAAIINGTEDFIDSLCSLNINIVSAGGETADVGDLVKTVIVDSTVVARIKKSEIIDNAKITAGDVIVGLASFGKATYEETYNSGIGSNGLTAARHEVLSKSYAKFVESYDASLPESLIYSGKCNLSDSVKTSGMNVGKLLLSPTRTYLPVVRAILNCCYADIHGMIHCTGGGQTKILHFVEHLNIVKDNLFEIPEVFKLIQQQSNMDWREMYQVFNMGHRLEIIVPQNTANQIIQIAKQFNIDAQVIGYCEKSNTKKLTIKSPYGTFEY